MRLTRIVLTVACATAATFARAGDLKKSGPLAPSTGLIMARGTITEPALEFLYAAGAGTAAPATLTFDIAKDFSVADSGDVLTTYDYALKRVLVLDDKAHSFHNISLYALVAALAQAPGVDAAFTSSGHALDKDQAARLAELLRAFTPLSPAAVDHIRASGFLPQTISFGSGKDAQSWTLQSATAVSATYPMATSRRAPKLDPVDVRKAFGDAAGAVIAAAGGNGQGRRPPKEFRAAVEKALAARQVFQALLLSREMIAQYGPASDRCPHAKRCHALKTIEALAARDPRALMLLAPSPEIADSAKALTTMKRDDLSNAYMLDETAARYFAFTGRPDESLKLLAAALKADPVLPSLYQDLGDLWRANGEPVLAWYAYDLARVIDTAKLSPAAQAIDAHEAELEKKYPEMF